MTEENKMLIELLNSIREEIREIKMDLNSLREDLHKVNIETLEKASKDDLAKKLDVDEFKKFKKTTQNILTVVIIFLVLVAIQTNTFGDAFKMIVNKF